MTPCGKRLKYERETAQVRTDVRLLKFQWAWNWSCSDLRKSQRAWHLSCFFCVPSAAADFNFVENVLAVFLSPWRGLGETGITLSTKLKSVAADDTPLTSRIPWGIDQRRGGEASLGSLRKGFSKASQTFEVRSSCEVLTFSMKLDTDPVVRWLFPKLQNLAPQCKHTPRLVQDPVLRVFKGFLNIFQKQGGGQPRGKVDPQIGYPPGKWSCWNSVLRQFPNSLNNTPRGLVGWNHWVPEGVGECRARGVQGYLAHKTSAAPLGPPSDPWNRPTVGS